MNGDFMMKPLFFKVSNLIRYLLVITIFSVFPAYAQVSGPFLPPSGQKVLIVGQDINSLQNYVSSVGITPGGVANYINISDLSGFTTNVDNGGGLNNVGTLYQTYPNSVLQIGVYLVGSLGNIASGALDNNINTLISTLKSWNRPIFLRWGYEFDGPWNSYDPTQFKAAWIYMHNKIQAAGANNIAMVWHSSSYCPQGQNQSTYNNQPISAWWPGSSYVDWVGISYFRPDDCANQTNTAVNSVVSYARSMNKPVLISESTPQRYDLTALTYSNNPTANDKLPTTAAAIWSNWFAPYFTFISNNSDVIKAVSYINADWDAQSMWAPPYSQGYWGDTRVQANSTILANWRSQITNGSWLNSSSTLFSQLGSGSSTSSSSSSVATSGSSSSSSSSAGNTSGAVTIEAESGTLQGSSTTYTDSAASGGAGVAYINSVGSGFSLKNVPASGSFVVRYASTLSGTITYYINGAKSGVINFTSTGNWVSSYSTVSVKTTIPAGATFAITYQAGDTSLNVDDIQFVPAATSVTMEAESGTLLGSASVYQDASASGGSGVAYISSSGAGFQLTNVPASNSFVIRYASALSGNISYYVNGAKAGVVSFTSTGNWTGTYNTVTVNTNIPAGATFAIQFTSGDTALNADSVQFNASPSSTKVEAEAGSLVGGASVYSDSAASGGAGVAYISALGAGFNLSNVPASKSFVLHYASTLSGTISYYVNGSKVGTASFTSTGAWTGVYNSITVPVNIPSGATFGIIFQSGDSAINVDYLGFNN